MAPLKFVVIFVYFLITIVNSGKILIFVPQFTDGQTILFVRFGDLLASAGHEVTLFRPQYNPDLHPHEPKASPAVKEINYVILENATTYRQWMQETTDYVYREASGDLWTIMSYALDGSHKFALDGCEKQLSDQDLMKKLKNDRFDLAVVGENDACAFGMIRVLEIPTYTCFTNGALTDYLAWAANVPSPTSYVPNTLTQFSDRMSLGQRVQNLAAHILAPPMYRRTTIEPTNRLFRRYYGKEFPNLETLVSETPIIFVNNEELIDFPRPILHKVVYIGGFYMDESEPLSTSWLKIMDNAKDGVVLISFGAVLKGSEMPLKWKAAILKACDKFPTYTFIWKHEEELERAKNVTNLKLSPWLPQEKLLAHPKMKAFVTEGGMNSIIESTTHGVPMVIVPLFGDQMGNRWRAEQHGIAVGINKKKFATRTLFESLQKVLLIKSYKDNATHLRQMIKQKPVKPSDLAKGWIEFLIEYKTIPNLKPASLHLSIFEYFLVDAFLIILLIMAMFAYVTYRLCYCYYWRCCETSFHDKKE